MSAALAKLTTDEAGPLSPQEADDLARLEDVARKGFDGFFATGNALAEIRDRRLYRQSYPTFEDYLSKEWGFTRQCASNLIRAAGTIKNLPEGMPHPANEWAARGLRVVPDESKAEVYADAVESAGGNAPNRTHVDAAVAKAIKKGIIPPNATVIVTEPESLLDRVLMAECDAADRPKELPDADWLATLPAREKIPAGYLREWFDADALLWRHTEPLRQRFKEACRPFVKLATRGAANNIGRYQSRHNGYFRVNDPSRWVACEVCHGTARTVVGECPDCKGKGYHLTLA